MEKVTLENIASNPFITLGSFSLAVLGIALAIVFYFKSQKNKTPCFDISSSTIIEGLHNSLNGLEVRYKDSTQERITVTKLAFWNDGKDTIDIDDLVKKDPIRIGIPEDVDVLDIQIINVSEKSNTVLIEENEKYPNYYIINFDFLDYKEYFVIQVIHNGSSNERINIEGKIKGVKSIKKAINSQVQPITISVSFPFFNEQIGSLLFNPLLIKYVGSISYFLMAMIILWDIITVNTQWFMWLGFIFFLFISGFNYYMYRYIVPVKI